MKHPWTWFRDECTWLYDAQVTPSWRLLRTITCAGLVISSAVAVVVCLVVAVAVFFEWLAVVGHVNVALIGFCIFVFSFSGMVGVIVFRRKEN